MQPSLLGLPAFSDLHLPWCHQLPPSPRSLRVLPLDLLTLLSVSFLEPPGCSYHLPFAWSPADIPTHLGVPFSSTWLPTQVYHIPGSFGPAILIGWLSLGTCMPYYPWNKLLWFFLTFQSYVHSWPHYGTALSPSFQFSHFCWYI